MIQAIFAAEHRVDQGFNWFQMAATIRNEWELERMSCSVRVACVCNTVHWFYTQKI